MIYWMAYCTRTSSVIAASMKSFEYGYSREMTQRIVNLVDRAEYKRRQAAIVLRVTSKAFGSDRRLPVTNKYRS